jgi:hypothetical protein
MIDRNFTWFSSSSMLPCTAVSALSHLRGQQLHVRGILSVHALGQDKRHPDAELVQSLRQPVTGGAQPPADKRRELPAQHEDTHPRPLTIRSHKLSLASELLRLPDPTAYQHLDGSDRSADQHNTRSHGRVSAALGTILTFATVKNFPPLGGHILFLISEFGTGWLRTGSSFAEISKNYKDWQNAILIGPVRILRARESCCPPGAFELRHYRPCPHGRGREWLHPLLSSAGSAHRGHAWTPSAPSAAPRAGNVASQPGTDKGPEPDAARPGWRIRDRMPAIQPGRLHGMIFETCERRQKNDLNC